MGKGELAARFIEVFRVAALQAGAVARHCQGQVRPQSKPAGGVPEAEALTAIDLAAQDVILHALHAHLPDVAVDAEEDTELVRCFPAADGRPLVVIDPIDGTLNYIRGSRDFAVMAALIEDGRFTASLLHFPIWRMTYFALAGAGAFVQTPGQAPLRMQSPPAPDNILITPDVEARVQDRLRTRCEELIVSRCSAVDAIAPAAGVARVSLSPSHPDRRRALGFLVTREAGGVVQIGGRVWEGEDPQTLAADASPAIAASSQEDAVVIADLLTGR